MRVFAAIVIACSMFCSDLQADGIELPPSKLLRADPVINWAQQDHGAGFTEVELPQHRDQPAHKNPWQAFGMSLLLPGAGEFYVGKSLRSKLFFAAEVSLWASFASFRHLGQWKEDDYRQLARVKAGVDIDNKDDHFFDLLGFYESREKYNKFRVYDRGAPYFPDNETYFWKWDSEESRLRYRDLKNDSRTYFRDADFTLGLIIANHVLSAVDAYWAAIRSNRRIESGFSGIHLKLLADGGFMVTVDVSL